MYKLKQSLLVFWSALTFAFGRCCDRHPGHESQFHIQEFFTGQFLYRDGSRLFYGAEDDMNQNEILPPRKEKRRTANKLRKPKDRSELQSRLRVWRAKAHEEDALASVRPPTYILDDKGIKIVASLHPSNIQSAAQLVLALNEIEEWQEEWATKILDVIHSYDQELENSRKAAVTESRAQQKRRKADMDLASFQKDTEERLRASAAQGFSRFANIR